MPEVTANMMVSLDGYATGEGQSSEQPFGDIDVDRLEAWRADAEENAEELATLTAAGAFIMGRNMFGPDRGEWDLDWHGWWGDNPPYHGPVFVLAHRPRPDLVMEGGTTFSFVTDGPEAALERARAAAGTRHVSIAGGPSTTNAFLALGLIDELRLHIVPITLGEGIRIFDGVGDLQLTPTSSRTTSYVTHVTWRAAPKG